MQVDFYQLSRDPVDKVLPAIAARVLDGGGRLLVVAGDDDRLAALSQGLWSAALQLASAICRHYWPVALVAAVCFRRCRQVVLVAAVVDGVVDWASRNANVDDDSKRVGLFSYVLLRRLDDIAYGLGLWQGVVRERHLGALKPQIRT